MELSVWVSCFDSWFSCQDLRSLRQRHDETFLIKLRGLQSLRFGNWCNLLRQLVNQLEGCRLLRCLHRLDCQSRSRRLLLRCNGVFRNRLESEEF